MDIFIKKLILEMIFSLQLQCPTTFDKMVDSAMKIEDVLVRKCDITIYKDTKFSNYNNKEKSKY